MHQFILRQASFSRLWILLALLIGATAYLFDPGAAWHPFFQAGDDQAPEFQPAFDRDVIYNFFANLDSEQRAVYVYYEGVADTVYFVLLALFSACLLALAAERLKGGFLTHKWPLGIPLIYLCSEVLEGAGLLLTLLLLPARIEPLLFLSDIATAIKFPSVFVLFVMDAIAGVWLIVNAVKGTRSSS
jgi:hypothetical protein